MPTIAARAMSRNLAWIAPGICLLWTVPARAETRDFSISVDGTPAGAYHMQIAREANGSSRLDASANVRFRAYLVKTYSYAFRGTETWNGDRLVGLSSRCNDDGKTYQVSATPVANGLSVQVNGRVTVFPADAWVSTYWRLPAASLRGRLLTILDADNGRTLRGTLQFIGRESVAIGGGQGPCDHYRLPELGVDLWYDEGGTLARQEYVEEGRRIVLRLDSVGR